jgi:ABC-type sulfate/molybdate transport systems ATPase subunit
VGASNVLRGSVWEGHLHFGRSAVAGAYHLDDGGEAHAYVRPHDVRLTNEAGELSFPVTIDRRTNLGWMSKLTLRLHDGQVLVAEVPNEDLEGVSFARPVFVDLRHAKVFGTGPAAVPADAELASV